jgi:AcrR family transcriptional regulator
MSPSPARTSEAAIVEAGRDLLEERGLDAVTMATVAERVGVKAPSLYKHVRDRPDLVGLIVADAARELSAVLTAAAGRSRGDPARRVRAIATAYRRFARTRPRASSLLFADLGRDVAAPSDELASAARPVLDAATDLVGAELALPAARALTAFVHGFTTMEAAGAFRLGGSVDRAYAIGVDALIRGLQASASARTS